MAFQKAPDPRSRIFSSFPRSQRYKRDTPVPDFPVQNESLFCSGGSYAWGINTQLCNRLAQPMLIFFSGIKLQEVSSELGKSMFDLCATEGQIDIIVILFKKCNGRQATDG